jgi:hypothetical protein
VWLVLDTCADGGAVEARGSCVKRVYIIYMRNVLEDAMKREGEGLGNSSVMAKVPDATVRVGRGPRRGGVMLPEWTGRGGQTAGVR